jgi:2-polyprenyl-6-methoxyphenol hydroxylase-like FAD-dependent oxidoreductase
LKYSTSKTDFKEQANNLYAMKKTALISGACVAGLTIAYWLNQYDYDVTVVEIAPDLRKGGAAIDIRGEALNVAKRMHILDKIKTKKITTAVEFVDAENNCLATIKNFGEGESGRDIELNRDHLIEIIYEAATTGVEYLFNTRIKAINQINDKVSVIFDKGQPRDFDFVFGADGVHSTVRKLVFGEESLFNHFFGAYFAILKAEETLGKLNRGQLYNLPNKMAATSDNGNSFVLFRSHKLDYNYQNGMACKKILMEAFAGCGWKVPGIVKAMINSDNLYFDEVCQIKMLSWTKDRIALIGDAAYCAGFPTGMGTSLAMQGATILADELAASNGDYLLAFSKYNNAFRPFVETVQATITNGLDFLVPETEEKIQLRNQMLN